MTWKVSYYNDKVVKEIKKWPKTILAKYLNIIDLIEEHGPQLGEPMTKVVAPGLFEIRPKGKEGIGRAFFCYAIKNEIVILHGFIKKTQTTPKNDLDIAKKRLKEIKNG